MKPKAIIVCNAPANIDYVYTKEVLAELAELTDLYPEIVTDLSQGDFKDVEYMFSTWGMLAPSEEELAAYVPNLKALFYGAGATDRFVRPFFARNIRVFSAWHANAIPVAEFSLAQILLALKGYFLNTRDVHSKGWKGAFRGPGIYGDTVALIGDGAISTKIQALLKNFNVNVIAIPSRPELHRLPEEDGETDYRKRKNRPHDRSALPEHLNELCHINSLNEARQITVRFAKNIAPPPHHPSHPFEPPRAAAVDFDLLEEHPGGPDPKAEVAVEKLIDRHRLQRLAVRRKAEKPIHLPLVMAKVMADAGLPLLRRRAFPRKLKVCFDHKIRSCSQGRTVRSGRNADGTSEADAVLAINAGDGECASDPAITVRPPCGSGR